MGVLLSIGGWLKRVVVWSFEWLRDNPLALMTMVGAVVGAWFMWKRSSNKIASLEDAVQVQAVKVTIAKKVAKAEYLEASADDRAAEVVVLKREIAASQKRVVEIHEGEPLEGKSDAEIAALFTDVGL